MVGIPPTNMVMTEGWFIIGFDTYLGNSHCHDLTATDGLGESFQKLFVCLLFES